MSSIQLMFVSCLQSLISLMPQSPGRINNSDRFIPSRAGNNWQTKFAMITVSLQQHIFCYASKLSL